MQRYAKLVNGYPKYAPNPIRVGDNYVGNPPAYIYLEQGYKPVTYTPMPEPQEGYYYEEKWVETHDAITQDWELVEEPQE